MTRTAFLAVLGVLAATAAGATARHRAPTPASAPATAVARRLDDVRIAGELEPPRVTFITARRPPRFHDFPRTSWVRTSRQFAEAFAPPPWSSTVAPSASDSRKEMP